MCRTTHLDRLGACRPHGWGRRAAVLLCWLGLAVHPLQAQDWLSGASPWSGINSTMSPAGAPSMPAMPGHQFGGRMAEPFDLTVPYGGPPRDTWQMPYSAGSQRQAGAASADSHQPDLTGIWRGSGGETVEVRRNRARIWSGQGAPCSCVFFLVGQRLIAYSPDTDQVRKYWFLGGTGRFSLIDEAGNLMNFQRTR